MSSTEFRLGKRQGRGEGNNGNGQGNGGPRGEGMGNGNSNGNGNDDNESGNETPSSTTSQEITPTPALTTSVPSTIVVSTSSSSTRTSSRATSPSTTASQVITPTTTVTSNGSTVTSRLAPTTVPASEASNNSFSSGLSSSTRSAIIGGAVGGGILLLLALFICCCCRRRRTKNAQRKALPDQEENIRWPEASNPATLFPAPVRRMKGSGIGDDGDEVASMSEYSHGRSAALGTAALTGAGFAARREPTSPTNFQPTRHSAEYETPYDSNGTYTSKPNRASSTTPKYGKLYSDGHVSVESLQDLTSPPPASIEYNKFQNTAGHDYGLMDTMQHPATSFIPPSTNHYGPGGVGSLPLPGSASIMDPENRAISPASMQYPNQGAGRMKLSIVNGD